MVDDDFQSAMQGVKKTTHNQTLEKQKLTFSHDFNYRRQQAENNAETTEDGLTSVNQKRFNPDDIVGLKKPGVQDGVYKNFRLGKYPIQARLDLHQHSVEEARVSLLNFIKDATEYELRTLIVIHGRGKRNQSNQAILKNMTIQWLEQIDTVLAFHSAQKADGGAGATYVLIKKSDKAKQKNRERFGLK